MDYIFVSQSFIQDLFLVLERKYTATVLEGLFPLPVCITKVNLYIFLREIPS